MLYGSTLLEPGARAYLRTIPSGGRNGGFGGREGGGSIIPTGSGDVLTNPTPRQNYGFMVQPGALDYFKWQAVEQGALTSTPCPNFVNMKQFQN